MTAYKADAENLPSYLLDAAVEPDQHPDTHQEVILTSGVLIAESHKKTCVLSNQLLLISFKALKPRSFNTNFNKQDDQAPIRKD